MFNVFETHSNGNKSRTWDYYAGTLYGGKDGTANTGACIAYCNKEGFNYAAVLSRSLTEYDCFCGNNEGTNCNTDNCIRVRIVSAGKTREYLTIQACLTIRIVSIVQPVYGNGFRILFKILC